MSEWLNDLVSEEIRNPVAKEPEITKVTGLQKFSEEELTQIDDQLAVSRRLQADLRRRIYAGEVNNDLEQELNEVNEEIDSLLEIKNLATSDEMTNAIQPKGALSEDQLKSAVEAFRLALSTDAMHATDTLKRMYPDFTEDEINQVKEKYWEPIFGGFEKTEANLEGQEVGAAELNQAVDEVMSLGDQLSDEDIKRSFLVSDYNITNAALQSEIIRRAITTSPDLEHRDPEEVFTLIDTQQTGPHTGEEKEAAPAPKEQPQAPAIPAEPTTAPAPTEEMVRRRINLQTQLDALNDRLAQLREEAMKTLVPLQQQVEAEEPMLREALKKLDDMSVVVDNWKAALKTRKGFDRVDTAGILDKVQEIAKQESDRFYKLIAQLRGTEKYLTHVKPTENLELKRTKTSLSLEGDVVPQKLKEWWGQIKNWFSRTFMPSLDAAENSFEDMQSYLDAIE